MRERRDHVAAKRASQRGSTLLVVIVATVALAGFAIFAMRTAVDTGQYSRVMTESALEWNAAEAAAELMRTEVVADLEQSGLTITAWLDQIRAQTRWPPAAVRTYEAFPGVRAWVDRASPIGNGDPWIEVVGATIPGASVADRSVRIRVALGQSRVFDLALLADTTNCMFCHLKVTGDVGTVSYFNPGWGPQNSGAGSSILGSVFAGDDVRDGTGAHEGTVNGVGVTGTVNEQFEGEKLVRDEDGDGAVDFPALDPDRVAAEAAGSIFLPDNGGTPGQATLTPLEDDYDPAGQGVGLGSANALGPVIEGNLVLVGTFDNPITLTGDVLVTGDVVLKGYIDGKGAIHAGRNVYVAGDVIYKDPSTAMNDVDAAVDVRDPDKDELRLSARGNVLVGNWTYRTGADLPGSGGVASGILPMKYRQQAEFLTQQFDTRGGESFFVPYDPETGRSAHEVVRIDGMFYDDQGDAIPAGDVVQVTGAGLSEDERRYDGLFRPGQLQSDGSFDAWLSDAQYREILGTQTYEDMTWRVVPGQLPAGTDLAAEFEANLPGYGQSSADSVEGRERYRFADQDWTDGRAGSDGLFVSNDGVFFRVLEKGRKPWATQVTHIDAFLFANRRIGGMVRWGGLTINGGVISREIGVLAPAFNLAKLWALQNATVGDVGWWAGNRPLWMLNPPQNAFGEANDRFYVNYDFRLRNGGHGFDLVAEITGDRFFLVRQGRAEPPLLIEALEVSDP